VDINNILHGVECACGKTHHCDIEYVYIEAGAIARLEKLCGQNENILIVADENTYSAAGEYVEKVLCRKTVKKVIFSGETVLIPNENVKSGDYSQMKTIARPSHADYSAECKYHGYQDSRGGGHFSGRITAALVAAGAICKYALEKKGIHIGTHVKKCAGVSDREFCDLLWDIKSLNEKKFAVLNENTEDKMKEAILEAAEDGDSVGGILETAVVGMPSGVGEPWFDSLEGMLSHMMFSIPAVKGIEFGAGFAFADMKGSEANDPMRIAGDKVYTVTNNNGGINGGITNGMPVIFRTVIKPTPTIFKPQDTINFKTMTEEVLEAKGRHDPAIVHRARVVQDAATAIVMCDVLAARFGTDFIIVSEKKD